MKKRHTTIGVKIITLFAVMAVICGVLTGIIRSSITETEKIATKISDNYLDSIRNIDNVPTNYAYLSGYLNEYLLSDKDGRPAIAKKIQTTQGTLLSNLASIKENMTSDREKSTYEKLETSYNNYLTAYNNI